MVPSERKVTHTLLLFVFTVGGATLPQNLQGWLRVPEGSRHLFFPVSSPCRVNVGWMTFDLPDDHRAERHLLLHLQPVKEAGRWSLHSQVEHVDLDDEGGRDLDHPHAQ